MDKRNRCEYEENKGDGWCYMFKDGDCSECMIFKEKETQDEPTKTR